MFYLVINTIQQWQKYNSHILSHEYRMERNQYSQLLFISEDPLHQFTDAKRFDEYDIKMPAPMFTEQLWWHHSAHKSEKTVLSNNGETSDR